MAWTRVVAVEVGEVATFWEYIDVWKEESVGPADGSDVRDERKRGVMVFK